MTDEELIKKVAEEVMGFHYENIGPEQLPVWINDKHEIVFDCIREYKFNPLTNLNHSFMVVERMRELRYGCSMSTLWQDSAGNLIADGYLVGMGRECFDHIVTYKSLGRAICMAALKAVRT